MTQIELVRGVFRNATEALSIGNLEERFAARAVGNRSNQDSYYQTTRRAVKKLVERGELVTARIEKGRAYYKATPLLQPASA